MDKELSEVLKKHRDELDFNQQEMADLLDISRSHYANLEAGKNPSLEVFMRIVDLIGARKIFSYCVPKENKTA